MASITQFRGLSALAPHTFDDVSLDDDVLVTDRFHPTKPVAQLLDLRARQLRAA